MNRGMKFTGRAIEALATAGKFNYKDDWKFNPNGYGGKTWRAGLKRHIFCNGYVFHSMREFGEHMISEMNRWMIVANLVDLRLIENAKMSGAGDYHFFSIETI